MPPGRVFDRRRTSDRSLASTSPNETGQPDAGGREGKGRGLGDSRDRNGKKIRFWCDPPRTSVFLRPNVGIPGRILLRRSTRREVPRNFTSGLRNDPISGSIRQTDSSEPELVQRFCADVHGTGRVEKTARRTRIIGINADGCWHCTITEEPQSDGTDSQIRRGCRESLSGKKKWDRSATDIRVEVSDTVRPARAQIAKHDFGLRGRRQRKDREEGDQGAADEDLERSHEIETFQEMRKRTPRFGQATKPRSPYQPGERQRNGRLDQDFASLGLLPLLAQGKARGQQVDLKNTAGGSLPRERAAWAGRLMCLSRQTAAVRPLRRRACTRPASPRPAAARA